jgi:hypothetical protein
LKKENIYKIIDDIFILKSINDGVGFDYIISELYKRRESIFKIIESEKYKNYKDLTKLDPDSFENKIRYVIYFVQISTSRIEGLKWALKNKDKLSLKYSDIKIFGLLRLKSKLENETP